MSFRPLVPIFPCAFQRPGARHELGTTMPINRGSNFARFSHGIPPLLADCQPGIRGIRTGFLPFEAWKSGGQADCQAVRQSRHWPPACEALVGRVGGKPALAGTCCLQPASLCLRAADGGAVGGCQPAEEKFPRTVVDRRTADPRHPRLRNRPNFLQPPQPTLLLFGRSYIKVYTLFQFS